MALFYRENDDKPRDLGWYTMNISRGPHGIVP
jgi:hypothetical protein